MSRLSFADGRRWAASAVSLVCLMSLSARPAAYADEIDELGAPDPKPADTGSPGPASPSGDAAPAAGLEDVTDKLSLKPGLVIVFPIHQGIDTHWKKVGDYLFQVKVTKYGAEGLYFDWTMSAPADAAGSRAVAAEDLKGSFKVSLFYPRHESCTLAGFTSTVRVSDALYQSLKAGSKSRFELDGPDEPARGDKDARCGPRSLEPQGIEEVPVQVNGRTAMVRAIKAAADNGWTYWVMDNPAFPLLVKGDGPFQWSEPRLDTTLAEVRAPAKEAPQPPYKVNDVIRQLEEKGVATTYAIHFDFNKATIKDRSKPLLNELGKYLAARREVKLEVQGHTDNKGGRQYNLKLSKRRAQAVVDYLVKRCGIARTRLKAAGYGFARPVAGNGTEKGRALNRRVVFKKF